MTPRNEHGAVATEYALLVALIALIIFAAVAEVGGGTNGLFESVCNPPSPFSC